MKLGKITLASPVVAISVALVSGSLCAESIRVSTVENLTAALADEKYDLIELEDNTYELSSQLDVDRVVTIRGSSYENCILKQTNVNARVVKMTADARLVGLTITGGSMGRDTAGLGIYMNKGTVERCRVCENWHTVGTGALGSGVYITGGTLLQTLVVSNGLHKMAAHSPKGAAVSIGGSSGPFAPILIDSCLIADNLAGGSWSGMGCVFVSSYWEMKTVTIRNTTIAGNETMTGAAGLYCEGNTSAHLPVLENCIVAGNVTPTTAVGCPNWFAPDPDVWKGNVSYCLWGKEGSCTCVGTYSYLEDPGFTDAANGGYTLAVGSQAIAMGHYYEGISADLIGTARRNPPDVGCYQSDHAMPLRCEASFGPEAALIGSTFCLTAAVEHATASATYDYYWTLTDWGGNVRRFTGELPMVSDLAANEYEVMLAVSNRDVVADNAYAIAPVKMLVAPLTNYVTCAEGATPVRPYCTPETAATSIHDVMPLTLPGSTVILDAGTHKLTKSVVLDKRMTVKGAGRESTILKASAANFRLADLDDSEAVIRDLTLANGYSGGDAGTPFYGGIGVLIRSNGGKVINCAIVGNTLTGANREGSAINSQSANALVDCCVIACNTNTLSNSGFSTRGVIWLPKGTIRSSIIRNNVVCGTGNANSGHILYMNGKESAVENCTIIDNLDEYTGGSTVYMNGSYLNTARLYNTILAGNATPNVQIPEGSTLPNLRATGASYYYDVKNCFFVGSAAFDANSFVGTDAKFVDAAAGDYRLRRDSPCRSKGVNRDWMADALDVYGERRLIGRKVDIGAAETLSGLTLLVR